MAVIGAMANPTIAQSAMCKLVEISKGDTMSNNPGKKGKPAPWVKRERDDRDRALDAYKQAHHPAYREWCDARGEVGRKARAEADALYPGFSEISRSMKHADKVVGAWAKANKNPMTWEELQALEAEFAKTYVPIDRS